jgi:hypothetical protein
MATGSLSGLLVIDTDSAESTQRFETEFPEVCTTLQVQTSRGKHFYFSFENGISIDADKVLGSEIGIRGQGGFVILPPSVHANGGFYPTVEQNKPIQLPEALKDRLFVKSEKRTGSAGAVQQTIPEGPTQCFLNIPGWLNAPPGNVGIVHPGSLHHENEQNCDPPLPEREVEAIAKSVSRYEPAAERAVRNNAFTLIEAEDLLTLEEPETEWLWEGILPAGGLSLLVAKPKVGKTTLAFNLAVAVAAGEDFLGRKTKQAQVIYLAHEEKKSEIQKKLKALPHRPGKISFYFGSAPEKAIQEVRHLIQETKAGFLVVDVLQKLCRVKDLNDYAQVTNTLEPLMSMAREENCHIMLTHHAGKADRRDGDDILGSTALLGGVDTSIHIKKREQRRTFFTIQRYGGTSPRLSLS